MAMFYVNNIYRLSAAFSRVLLGSVRGQVILLLDREKNGFSHTREWKNGLFIF